MDIRRIIVCLTASLLLAAGVMLVQVAPVQACPSCSEAALAGDAADPDNATTDADGNIIKPALGAGFYYSILLMLAVPFGMAGTFGYFVWQYSREHQAKLTTVSSQSAD